jgi:hypothetical protein
VGRKALTLGVVALCGGCGRSRFDQSQVDAGVDAGEPGLAAGLVQVIGPPYVSAPMISSALTVTGGNLLLASVFWDKPGATITLSDTAGLVWNVIDAQQTSFCASRTTNMKWWYAVIDVSVTVIVTASHTTSDPLGMFVAEYAGIDPENPLHEVAGIAAPGATNTMTTPALVTTEDTAIVAAFADALGGGMMAPGAGWSARAFDSTFYWMLTDNAPRGAPGTYTPSGTLPVGASDACWVASAAAFRLR